MTETAAKRMKVVDVPQPGGPEALVLAERPVPEPGRGEVLIKVAAAGLNRADILQRRGFYPSPPGAPSYPGLEVSGTVAALGDGVTRVQSRRCGLRAAPGRRLCRVLRVDAGQVLPIPGSLDMIEAASLPEAMFTVWSNVFGFGRLQPGETSARARRLERHRRRGNSARCGLWTYRVHNGGLG